MSNNYLTSNLEPEHNSFSSKLHHKIQHFKSPSFRRKLSEKRRVVGVGALVVMTFAVLVSAQYLQKKSFENSKASASNPSLVLDTYPYRATHDHVVYQSGLGSTSVKYYYSVNNQLLFGTYGSADSYMGMKFEGMLGLSNYNITKATLELTPNKASTVPIDVSIYGEKSTNPLPFKNTTGYKPSDHYTRRTTAVVSYKRSATETWTAEKVERVDVTGPVKEAVTSPTQTSVALVMKGNATLNKYRTIYNDQTIGKAPRLVLELTLKPGSSNTLPIVYDMYLASPPTRYAGDIVNEYNSKLTFSKTYSGTTPTVVKYSWLGNFGATLTSPESWTAMQFGGVNTQGQSLTQALTGNTIAKAELKLTAYSATVSAPIQLEIYGDNDTTVSGFSAAQGFTPSDAEFGVPLDALDPEDELLTLDQAQSLPSFSLSDLPSLRSRSSQKVLYKPSSAWPINSAQTIDVTAPVKEIVGTDAVDRIGLLIKGVNGSTKRVRYIYNDQNATRKPKLVLTLRNSSGVLQPPMEFTLATNTRTITDVMNEDGTAVTPLDPKLSTNWFGDGNKYFNLAPTGTVKSFAGLRFEGLPPTPPGYKFDKAYLVLTPYISSGTAIKTVVKADIHIDKDPAPEIFSNLYNKPSQKSLANLSNAHPIILDGTAANTWTKNVPVQIDITDIYTQTRPVLTSDMISIIIRGKGGLGQRRYFYNGLIENYAPRLRLKFLPVIPAPTVTFSAASTSLPGVNTGTTLSWTTTNAVTCTGTASPANSNWSGDIIPLTSTTPRNTGTLTVTTTFTLTCTNTTGSTTKNVTVNVAAQPLTVSLTAADTSITSGNATTLSWVTTNAANCTASASPANANWTGNISPLTSTTPRGTGNLTVSTTFTLTCSPVGGGTAVSDSVTVTVSGAPSPSAKKVNVLVVRYTDVNPTASYTTFLNQSMNDWEAQMENASKFHGQGQSIVDIVVKGIITRNQRTPNLGNPSTSLNAMLTANNNEICNRIASDSIDQVWHYQTPLNGDDDHDGIVENGEGVGAYNGEYTLSLKYDNGLCGGNRSFVHLTANGNPEAPTSLHTFGHFMESYLATIQTGDLFTGRFAGIGYTSSYGISMQSPFNQIPTRGCGNIHFAPNAASDSDNYDYYLTRQTNSNNNCKNWHPDGSGGGVAYGSEAWGCSTTTCADSSYYNWWFNNMPNQNSGLTYDADEAGSQPAKQIPAWFEFISDMDNTLKYYANRSDQWHMNLAWLQSYNPSLLLPDYIDKVSVLPSHPSSISFTLQHNSTGSNKLLLVAIGYGSQDIADETTRRVQSVSVAPTGGGTAVSLTRANKSTFQFAKNIEWWYVYNPPVNATISVVMGNGTYTDATAAAISVNSVNSTTPIGSASALGGQGVYQPGTYNYSLNIPSANGDIAFFGFATYSNGGGNYVTAATDITKVAEATPTGNTFLYVGAKRSTSTSTSVSWTTPQSWFWASAGVSIKKI